MERSLLLSRYLGVLDRTVAKLATPSGFFRAMMASLAVCSQVTGLPANASTRALQDRRAQVASHVVSPDVPQALAIGPNGDLYIVDTGRDKILERMPNGTFRVVAGDGREGHRGDGGPAAEAEIGLKYDSGIAVAANGAVYFSDSGNLRVQEVTPEGLMKTVAGGGTEPLGAKPVPALKALLAGGLGSAIQVAGLAINPQGGLDIGLPGGVYSLGSDGELRRVAGGPFADRDGAWDANPANESDFAPAYRLTFDGKGDLYVAGGGGWGLYEKAANGAMSFVEPFRGGGAGFWGSLASVPHGGVVGVSNAGIQRSTANGKMGPLTSSPSRLQAALNAALGSGPSGRRDGYFEGGSGIAVGRDGTVYVDMQVGVWSRVSAILAISPTGRVSALWRS